MIETKLLRIPKFLKEELNKKSEELGVSLNAYIVQILWESLNH